MINIENLPKKIVNIIIRYALFIISIADKMLGIIKIKK